MACLLSSLIELRVGPFGWCCFFRLQSYKTVFYKNVKKIPKDFRWEERERVYIFFYFLLLPLIDFSFFSPSFSFLTCLPCISVYVSYSITISFQCISFFLASFPLPSLHFSYSCLKKVNWILIRMETILKKNPVFILQVFVNFLVYVSHFSFYLLFSSFSISYHKPLRLLHIFGWPAISFVCGPLQTCMPPLHAIQPFQQPLFTLHATDHLESFQT